VKRALADWYDQKQKNYESWAKAYPVSLDEANFHKIDNQFRWVENAQVKFTPLMLISGYQLPDLYKMSDLKYMLR